MSVERMRILIFLLVVIKGLGANTLTTAGIHLAGRTFDINDDWKVVSKKCGDTALASITEIFKINESHLVRIDKESEDAAAVCKKGTIYDRLISSSKTHNGIYQENGTLKGAFAKQICWTKQNGIAVEPPTTDKEVALGPEQVEFLMTINNDSQLSLDLKGSKICPKAKLHLQLAKVAGDGRTINFLAGIENTK